ncbi:acyltransferase [Roseitranquillus sediminis]|uniref:acyltransferase n=1 Tax=Roseitranquillus sediminis TaxID=2809051 RepID=UPI001D0CDA12|nr:acyltransferase [Roseitranquillus sediminis]MBM9594013.1 acyltransferase [Roseitranquillus sediminis]
MPDALINRLLRAPVGLRSRVRIAALRACGMQIGRRCRLVRVSVPTNPWDVRLHDGVALDERVVLLAFGPRRGSPRIEIGARTYVNRHTMFDASLSITVGADVMIGPFCYVTDHDHDTAPGVAPGALPLVEVETIIGDRVWLGAGVTVMKGVRIGDDAVVGAGAVVTRDVAPGARVAGVPARAVMPSAGRAHA